MKVNKTMRQIIILISLLAFLSSCDQKRDHEFKFAVSGEFKPFSYVDKKGNLTGFDVELGNIIANELQKTSVSVKYKFSGIIEGLKSGRFDAAVASHTITNERKKQVNFSMPYYYSGPQVFSRIKKDSIKLQELEIAVSKGSTYQKMARSYTSKVKVYDSDNIALEALSRGRHDAVITDRVTGAMALKKGLKVIPNQSLGESKQGIALAKDSPELLSTINKILIKLRNNGTLTNLSKKYFANDITMAKK